MLHSRSVIKKVLESLNQLKIKKVVLDPVMVAKGGAKLIDDKAIIFLKKNLIKKKASSEDNLDLDLTGLISDDLALEVRAELMRFSDVFDTDDTKEIIYKSVTNATREMVREWLDQNLASIAKEVINLSLIHI